MKGSRITIPRRSQRMTSKTVTPRLFVSFRQLRCFSPNASSIPQNRMFPISDREISASKTLTLLTLVVAESLLVSKKKRPLWKAFFNSDHLEPQTTIYKWMFGETTIFYIKIWNHPIETSIYKWLFGVPGSDQVQRNNCWGYFRTVNLIILKNQPLDGNKVID